MEELDLDKYRLPETIRWQPKKSCQETVIRPLRSPFFLRGPVPLNWLRVAMKIGRAALSVGVILWYLRGLKKSMVFKIGIQDIADLINRSWLTAQRGLTALEKHGLITLGRYKGRKHIVTILEIENDFSDPNDERQR